MRAYLTIALLLVACGGGAVWVGRHHSLKRCQSAAFLVSQSKAPQKWLKAAMEDRFLTQLIHEGPVADSLLYISSQAGGLEKDFFAWHFFPQARESFSALGRASPSDEKGYLAALQAVAELSVPAACVPVADQKLIGLLGEAEATWRSRQTEVSLAKVSFARDQTIYCHAESLTNRLKQVLAAAEAKCGAKPSASCQKAADSIGQEIADIEKQKEFNRNKLRRKWSDEILAGLKCS